MSSSESAFQVTSLGARSVSAGAYFDRKRVRSTDENVMDRSLVSASYSGQHKAGTSFHRMVNDFRQHGKEDRTGPKVVSILARTWKNKFHEQWFPGQAMFAYSGHPDMQSGLGVSSVTSGTPTVLVSAPQVMSLLKDASEKYPFTEVIRPIGSVPTESIFVGIERSEIDKLTNPNDILDAFMKLFTDRTSEFETRITKLRGNVDEETQKTINEFINKFKNKYETIKLEDIPEYKKGTISNINNRELENIYTRITRMVQLMKDKIEDIKTNKISINYTTLKNEILLETQTTLLKNDSLGDIEEIFEKAIRFVTDIPLSTTLLVPPVPPKVPTTVATISTPKKPSKPVSTTTTKKPVEISRFSKEEPIKWNLPPKDSLCYIETILKKFSFVGIATGIEAVENDLIKVEVSACGNTNCQNYWGEFMRPGTHIGFIIRRKEYKQSYIIEPWSSTEHRLPTSKDIESRSIFNIRENGGFFYIGYVLYAQPQSPQSAQLYALRANRKQIVPNLWPLGLYEGGMDLERAVRDYKSMRDALVVDIGSKFRYSDIIKTYVVPESTEPATATTTESGSQSKKKTATKNPTGNPVDIPLTESFESVVGFQ